MAAPSVAVGIDLASVERLSASLRRRPALAERCFTAAERRHCSGHPERWASRWAVKEAVRKLSASLGISPLPAFAAIEVVTAAGGRPAVHLHDLRVRAAAAGLSVSITHDGGFAAAVVAAGVGPVALASSPDADLVLPPRPADGHKGTFGTVVVVAGSHQYSGAAFLAATGAARAGAGRVHALVPRALHAVLAVKCTEVMVEALPDGGRGVIGHEGVHALREGRLRDASALVVGPGLGRDEETGAALASLLGGLPCPAVVDADALTLAAAGRLDWRRAGRPIVLTPHPAEMARLLGCTTAEVQADREGLARRFATEHGVVVVLKGAHTVVAAPDGRCAVDGHATVALATGGTGDVLAGVCGAFLGAGLDGFDAAHAAVAVHAEAGVAVEAERGRAGALAGDVLEALPMAQERLRRALERRGR